ncbi:MAG: ATP-binding cassette domain-containing protein [Lachnospiraceae bacterium]
MKRYIKEADTYREKAGLQRYKKVLGFIVAALLLIQHVNVQAAQGTVTYGSESYSWYTGEVCPIGVYVNSDAPISSYEVCLEYDETMLQYLNGAAEQEGNRLYIRGTGSQLTYKTMLHFEPLQPGSTTIMVVSATCTAIESVSADISGNAGDVSGNQTMTVSVDMVQLGAAPITIYETISNQLSYLDTAQTAITNFQPDVYEYYLTVENEVEALDVLYEKESEGAVVTVSDTSLSVGENTISVSVKGTAGEAAVYTLYVTREEISEVLVPTPLPTSVPEETPSSPESTTGTETAPQNSNGEIETEAAMAVSDEVGAEDFEGILTGNVLFQRFLKAPFLWVATVVVTVIAVAYLLQLRKEKKQKKLADAEAEWEDDALQVINLEQTVIDVKHVTMKFRLAQEESSSLKEYMIRTVKGQNHYHYLTALDDISFEVKQGDVVGIIGTNGSGKSTILKIISGALNPTEGYVEVDKSKVQILTLGTGFDMELTARENVYLNGAIIGYTKEYIDEKYDDIVAFAELEGFMDERMKNFSSGMVSRLGFAIATMRDTPEILILDEVLSVGDMFFKAKSMKRIKEMIHGGATVLIVSHSPEVIIQNCNRAVWIEKGVLQMIGTPREVCAAYKEMAIERRLQ